jgi:type 1 glutamine amidotransferase
VILGARWVQGTTFHPERGPFRVRIDPGSPVVAGLADFDTDDEAYSALRVAPEVTVLAHHELEDGPHPLGWLHRSGSAPVGYLALGHDGRAYDTPETRELLRRTAEALLAEVDARRPVPR